MEFTLFIAWQNHCLARVEENVELQATFEKASRVRPISDEEICDNLCLERDKHSGHYFCYYVLSGLKREMRYFRTWSAEVEKSSCQTKSAFHYILRSEVESLFPQRPLRQFCNERWISTFSEILRRTFALRSPLRRQQKQSRKIELTNFFWRSFFPSTIFIILYLFYCCSLLVYAFASTKAQQLSAQKRSVSTEKNAKREREKGRILCLYCCEWSEMSFAKVCCFRRMLNWIM
jgi:hypothetical protein